MQRLERKHAVRCFDEGYVVSADVAQALLVAEVDQGKQALFAARQGHLVLRYEGRMLTERLWRWWQTIGCARDE